VDEFPGPPPERRTAVDPPPVTTAPTPSTIDGKPRHRSKSPVAAKPHDPNDTKAGDHGVTPAPADASEATGAGSGSARSAARPPANVEWKPTLLLPTDGSGARTPK
jgi:hypothetical protein